MARFFNTTGPCNPDDHYMLPPERRLIRAQLNRYIDAKLYWVLHAPRQTGKTTFLISWMKAINAGDEAVACYVSVEACQEFPRAEDAIPAICSAIQSYADTFLGKALVPAVPDEPIPMMLSGILKAWSALVAPKPLVVLFDEVDVLKDQARMHGQATTAERCRDQAVSRGSLPPAEAGRAKTWEERLTWDVRESPAGSPVTVVGG